MKRTTAALLGRETVRFLEGGRYTNPAGEVVEIADMVAASVAGTVSYPPKASVPQVSAGSHTTNIEVRNESTLVAARRFVEAGHRPVALNFASAKHPGGGFLGGALAQEESLARSSGLYACLAGNPMYDFHKAQRDPMYSNYAIYSPDVPVIRQDEGELLAQPYLCSFITSPAVNAGEVLARGPRREAEIRDAMDTRIRKILAIAAAHGHDTLILGAWGCGVFRNDGEEIAKLFQQAIGGKFHGVFARINFAVLDWSAERRFIGPFQRAFGSLEE
jgi:uncharacterized protein (TIGR02452 family)